MPASQKTPHQAHTAANPDSAFAQAILSLFARLPQSTEQKSRTPLDDARKKANAAAAKAALAAPPSTVRVTKWDGNETTWFTFDYPPSPEASGTLTVSSPRSR